MQDVLTASDLEISPVLVVMVGARACALPPLLRDVTSDLIASFGTRDAQLLLVLRAARIVPDEVWARRSTAAGGPAVW